MYASSESKIPVLPYSALLLSRKQSVGTSVFEDFDFSRITFGYLTAL